MKYLLALLSAALLLVGCSGNESAIAPEDSSASTQSPIADDAAEDTEASDDEVADDEAADDKSDIEADGIEAEEDDSDSEGSEDDGDIAGLDQKNVKLVVKSQTTGGQIVVEEVATSRDGWVSVHKSQADGGILLPDGIGQARVDSGSNEDVIIDLWEAPAIDEKLWVLLHIDAGNRGEYEFPGADQAVQKNGETMARSFTIKDSDSDKDEEEAE